MLLLVHCLLPLALCVKVWRFCIWSVFSFAIILLRNKEDGCFNYIVCLLFYGRLCSVPLPRDAVVWSIIVEFPSHT